MTLTQRALSVLMGCLGFSVLSAPAWADDALFIGNSFTFNVPQVLNAIVKAKQKSIDATMFAKGGKKWAFHLSEPSTHKILAEKKWN